jgi:hypothetical protein
VRREVFVNSCIFLFGIIVYIIIWDNLPTGNDVRGAYEQLFGLIREDQIDLNAIFSYDFGEPFVYILAYFIDYDFLIFIIPVVVVLFVFRDYLHTAGWFVIMSFLVSSVFIGNLRSAYALAIIMVAISFNKPILKILSFSIHVGTFFSVILWDIFNSKNFARITKLGLLFFTACIFFLAYYFNTYSIADKFSWYLAFNAEIDRRAFALIFLMLIILSIFFFHFNVELRIFIIIAGLLYIFLRNHAILRILEIIYFLSIYKIRALIEYRHLIILPIIMFLYGALFFIGF